MLIHLQLFFVTSGDLVGSVIIPGWDAGELWAVELNDQGLCLDSTDSTPITPFAPEVEVGDVDSTCKITVLIEGLTKAWGLFNDPVTNDLFVASWGSGVDALTPVYGFPPVSTQSIYPVGFRAPLTMSFA